MRMYISLKFFKEYLQSVLRPMNSGCLFSILAIYLLTSFSSKFEGKLKTFSFLIVK